MSTKETTGIVLYKSKDGTVKLDVQLEKDTVWLTQKLMAILFDVDIRTVNEHLQNIFESRELQRSSVIRKFRNTAADGKQYDTQFYNLDAIISVGYQSGGAEYY